LACSARKSSCLAAVFFLLLPLQLYADWSIIPSFSSSDPGRKPAAAVPAPAAADKLLKTPPETGGGVKSSLPDSAGKPPLLELPAAADSSTITIPAAAPATPGLVITAPRETVSISPALTVRSQLLTVDNEWRGAVYVDGGITVAAAATLTIQPGTVVRFGKGAGIHVLGRIVVKGTRENPVRLVSLYRDAQDSDWSGIFLSGTEKRNIFEHVSIEGAETAVFARFSSFTAAFVNVSNSAVGFKLQSSTAAIASSVFSVPVTAISAAKSEIFMEKCAITGGQSGIIVNSSAVEAREVSIESCRLTAFSAAASQLKLDRISVSACQSALKLNRCDGSVSDSVFSNNLESGAVLTDSNLRFTGNRLTGNKVGLQLDDNLPSLWANTFAGNSSYNLLYLGDDSMFVGGNSFGGNQAGENENKVFSKRPGAVQMLPVFAVEPAANNNSFGAPD